MDRVNFELRGYLEEFVAEKHRPISDSRRQRTVAFFQVQVLL